MDSPTKLFTLNQKITKCKASINSHVGRGGTRNGARGHCLELRYDSLRLELRDIDYKEWVAYCSSQGLDPRHTGFDLFA